MSISPGLPRLRSLDWRCSGFDSMGGVVVESQGWEERMVWCSDCSGEASIYREAWVLRGSGKVDMLAAIPASVGARRGCSRVLLVQAKLGVATARSGGA